MTLGAIVGPLPRHAAEAVTQEEARHTDWTKAHDAASHRQDSHARVCASYVMEGDLFWASRHAWLSVAFGRSMDEILAGVWEKHPRAYADTLATALNEPTTGNEREER